MEVFATIFILSLFASSSVVCANPKCCGEKQFVNTLAGTLIQVQDGRPPVGYNMWLPTAIDVDGQRVASDGYMAIMGDHNFTVRSIQLWKENKMYSIVNGQCTILPLTSSKPSQCVPDDAIFRGYGVLGKNEFVTLSFNVNPSSVALLSGEAYMSVSNRTCAPVSFGYTGLAQVGEKQIPSSQNVGFLNYTSGIKDPKKWFGLPSSCQNATMAEARSSDITGVEAAIQILSKIIPPFREG